MMRVRGVVPGAVEAARVLRRNATPAEVLLWESLRGRKLNGLKFRRQQPLGPYILDFVCAEKRIAIELDGRHHSEADQRAYDAGRTELLEAYGYRVFRFSNLEVTTNVDSVLEVIQQASTSVPAAKRTPLPELGEGQG